MPDRVSRNRSKQNVVKVCVVIKEIASTSKEIALALSAILALVLALLAYQKVGVEAAVPPVETGTSE